LLGTALHWKRARIQIKVICVFLFLGMTSQLIGAGIAHITFGTVPAPLYLLYAYALLFLIEVIGIVCLVNFLYGNTLLYRRRRNSKATTPSSI